MIRYLFVMAAVVTPAVAQSADMFKAKQNYDRFCAACHGFNGMSVMPDAPNLRLNQGLLQSDQAVIQKLKAGTSRKPPFMGMMSDAELTDLVGYIRTIR